MDEATNERTTTPSQTPDLDTTTAQVDEQHHEDTDSIAREVEAGNKILNRKEEMIWRGHPRHVTKIKYHALSFLMIAAIVYLGLKFPYLFILLIIPIGLSGYHFLKIKSNIFEISNKRLKIKKGIFSSVTKEIELYDIKSSVLEEKRNGKGYITFLTKNEEYGKIKFPRMNNPAEIHDQVRDIYEEIKLERNKITHTNKKK